MVAVAAEGVSVCPSARPSEGTPVSPVSRRASWSELAERQTNCRKFTLLDQEGLIVFDVACLNTLHRIQEAHSLLGSNEMFSLENCFRLKNTMQLGISTRNTTTRNDLKTSFHHFESTSVINKCHSLHPQNLPLVAMATSGYSEDLQPQQANAVTIATAAATPPSATKAAHFLSEIAPAAGSIVSAASSKSGLAGQNLNQNQKAVVLTSSAPHYVTPDIQHAAAQKSNGQSSSPQYIIVTVTGEGGAGG